MLTREGVIPLLLEACPDLQPIWDTYYATNYTSGLRTERSYHSDILPIIKFLFERARDQETACFPALFAVIERLLNEGDERVADLVVIGILEGVQNLAINRGLGHAVFLPWLGPQTRELWLGLIEYWDG